MYLEEKIGEMSGRIDGIEDKLDKILALLTPREIVGTKEAEEITGLHRNTLLNYKRRGLITGSLDKGKNFFYRDELEGLGKGKAS